MVDPRAKKRDGDELGNDSTPAPKRAHLEVDHDKLGPQAEYLKKKNAAYPKAGVEALDLKLSGTDEETDGETEEATDEKTDGHASSCSDLPTEFVYIVLHSQGEGASHYANESSTTTVGMYRSVVSANCNALMAFDGTVDYSEEDGRSCDIDHDIDSASFLHIKAPPFYPEDDTAGWWIGADACLYLSAGDTVDGATEVWVEKRVLDD
ncbi:hypothetical protein PG996_001863 [Apiospora saccharicola]|uniref:Uncharacterized protein n=1 Tax=Apiospora saccharicola TaxID=335842 RepID=A0ABR1WHZ1_9PEZI